MKNPARKKTNRHFRAEFTERPTECCSNEADSFLYRINFALPGLTSRRSFVVISFAHCSLFRIGQANAFAGMKSNDEFYFATAKQIYRILVSPQAKKTLTLLDCLNAAHFDFNIDSVWWLGQPRGAA